MRLLVLRVSLPSSRMRPAHAHSTSPRLVTSVMVIPRLSSARSLTSGPLSATRCSTVPTFFCNSSRSTVHWVKRNAWHGYHYRHTNIQYSRHVRVHGAEGFSQYRGDGNAR